MRALLTIVVIGVLAYAGYEYVYLPRAQPSAQGQAHQAGDSAQEAVNKMGEALGQAAQSIRTEAGQITGQAKGTAQSATQEAGDAARNAGRQIQDAGQQAREQAPDAGAGIESRLSSLIGDVKSGLQQADGSDTAGAARNSLDDAKNQLGTLGDKVAQLPTAARQVFASTCAAALPTIRSLAQNAKSSQAGQSMAPTIDAIVAKFEEWSRPPA